MAGFKLDVFKGLRPKVSATKLGLGQASIAENLKLGSGDLEPIPDKSTVQAVGSGRMSRTIYRFDNAGSPVWLEWDDYVDVARGPVKDDSLERTYYTGDTTGNGSPKLTTTALADLGGGGPYPEDWLYIGVPAPALAPTVTPQGLPEEQAADDRFASGFKCDEFKIDYVNWTVYPGTGTRNQTWRANSAALAYIGFDIQPGTSFRVRSIINANKITVESFSEPGVSMRTLNSDKTTPFDWHPMDEQGTSPNQEAEFIGWRIPVGMELIIDNHELTVGDVLTVSAVNQYPQFFNSLTTDFYEQDWPTETLFSEMAASRFRVTDVSVTPSAVLGDSQWEIYGSFYYDVDRAASTQSELEDRQYVYTYVNSLGEEGPPSEPSSVVQALDGSSVLLSEMSLPPTIGYDITQMRLYRTNSTEAGTEYQFVKEFDVSRTTRDEVASVDLGEVIATTTWDPPPATMKGITTMPNGMLVGFVGKQLHFCEPFFPHAYPAEYDQAVDYNIVGLASFGNSVVALTEGWPYIITGSHPRNVNVRPIKVNQACVNKESIATSGDKVYYASPDGLIEIGVNGIRIATESLLDKEDWATYSPSNMVSEFYEGRYYGFYDFDVSAVDDVITAEVSGTITDADELNITDGGRTVILTLTNDNWIAAGTSFDNQRQNIIDGLSDEAASPQTLGWDNIVRDTDLGVTDVVRTSDTVVTITLPASAGYAISQAETIRATIPHAALLISNTDITTQTFTIEPNAIIATSTLTGTLGGAAEADIVTGGDTVIITLTYDTWQTTLTTAMLQAIIDGLKSSTNEVNGWNNEVPQLISTTSVVRTSDTVVTVTLPAVPNYAVENNETITATIPHEALVLQQDEDSVSINSLGIIATGALSALFSGTAIDGGITEAEVVAGSETIIITLTNDTWIAAGTGPIGTTAQSQELLDALIATTSQTLGWNNVVSADLDPTYLVRTSSTVATITLPAQATYSVDTDETIGMTIPASVLTAAGALVVSNTFGITSQIPATLTLSGTIISAPPTEADIVAGGKTLIMTLANETWKVAGTGPIGSSSDTSLLLLGIDSAQSETTGWDLEVKANLVAGDIVRTSDTVATVTFGAEAAYDITATETITVTAPTQALTIAAGAVVASPTFQVTAAGVVSAAVTGTMTTDSPNQADIVAGGDTFIITLTNDTWVAAGAAFNAIRQDIIDGLDSAQSETNGWNNEVRDGSMVTTNVVRTSDTVVTVTVPATAAYSTTANETITVTVPASALVLSAGAITASPTVDVLAQAGPTTVALTGTITSSSDEDDIVTGGKTIILTLTNDTWLAAGTGPIGSTANTQAIIDGITAASSPTNGWNNEIRDGSLTTAQVVRTSDTVATITLVADAGYDITHTSTETVTATVPAAALSISASAPVASPTFTIDSVAPPATTAALTGTITAAIDEDDIVTGGKTIILTLTNDTWLAAGTGPIGSTANTQAIIDGISAAGTPTNGWNNEIRDGSLTTAQVVRTSSTVCTITLVADAGYDTGATETITATIPAAALTTSAIAVVASPTFDITHVGPAVSPVNPGKSNSRGLGTCYSGVTWNADGIEYINLAANPVATNSQGAWLDSGTVAEVWVEVTETVGAFDIGPLGRLQLNTSRVFYKVQSSVGSSSVTCYFSFYDAASGGNLLATSATNTYTAERT